MLPSTCAYFARIRVVPTLRALRSFGFSSPLPVGGTACTALDSVELESFFIARYPIESNRVDWHLSAC
jgi:hypothetical protein